MPPTFLILIQYTITKPTASHFLDGVITRPEAAAKRVTRKYGNTVETDTAPTSPIDRKRGVVVLAGWWCFNRCAAPPRWNIGDSTRGLERCHDLSGAQPHGNKQKLGNYATTAGYRPGAGRGKDYRSLTVPLGIQGRGHDTMVVSKNPRPNIAREDLCMVYSTKQGLNTCM